MYCSCSALARVDNTYLPTYLYIYLSIHLLIYTRSVQRQERKKERKKERKATNERLTCLVPSGYLLVPLSHLVSHLLGLFYFILDSTMHLSWHKVSECSVGTQYLVMGYCERIHLARFTWFSDSLDRGQQYLLVPSFPGRGSGGGEEAGDE